MKSLNLIFTLATFSIIMLAASLTYDKAQTTVEKQLEWVIGLLAIIYVRDVVKGFDKK